MNKNEGARFSLTKQQWKKRKSLTLYQNFKLIFLNFLQYFVDFYFHYYSFMCSSIFLIILWEKNCKNVWSKKSSCSIYDLIHRREYQKSHENNVPTWDFKPILQTNTIWIVWIYSQTPNIWDMYLITNALCCAETVEWNEGVCYILQELWVGKAVVKTGILLELSNL